MMCLVTHEWTNGQITSLDDGILPVFLKLFPPYSQFLLGWVAQSCPKLSIEGSRPRWVWDFGPVPP